MQDRRDDQGALVIRLAAPSDLPGVMALAAMTGPGFTTLPEDEAQLAGLVSNSMAAAKGAAGVVLLILEERSSGKIAGCAAVKRGGQKRPGFANFRMSYDNAGAAETLRVCDDYADLTEIGGLFVHPGFRDKGVGKALARSRYLYLATTPHSFGTRVFAELRGVIDENGASPFFDAVCAPWLGISFAQADLMCAKGDNERLVAELPAAPITIASLPDDAKAAMGDCHASGAPARAMLAAEGFRFEGVIDLLDGGALLTAPTTALTSLRRASLATIETIANPPPGEDFLFATTDPAGFRCVSGRGILAGQSVLCDEGVRDALNVGDGAVIRAVSMTSQAPARKPLTSPEATL